MKILYSRFYKRIKLTLFTKSLDSIKYVYFSNSLNIIRRVVDIFIIKYKYNNRFLKNKENFLKIHLGCGSIHFPRYINIDYKKTKATDYVCDCIRLPFQNDSVELIETYHMVEHLLKNDFLKALQNWWKKLIPGGKIIIECPNFDKTIKEYLDGNESRINNVYGLQRYDKDVHLYGYNFSRMKKILEECGYENIKEMDPQDYHRLDEPCMRVEANKKVVNINKRGELYGWYKREKEGS